MRLRLAAAVVGCVVLAGCNVDTQSIANSDAFTELVTGAIQEAEAGGAGDAQLEILRNAQAAGRLSLEDDRAAASSMIQCLQDAGSDGFWEDKRTRSGLLFAAYNSLANTPEQMAIADACDNREAFWVNQVYQMQPSSLLVNNAYLDQQAPIVRSCLESNGYATDPAATTNELLHQALQVKIDDDSAADCLSEANIDGF